MPVTLTPSQLLAWRKARRLSQAELARRLGIGLTTLQDYERGVSRDPVPRPRPIPLLVELAVAALSLGVASYDGRGVTFELGVASAKKRRDGTKTP